MKTLRLFLAALALPMLMLTSCNDTEDDNTASLRLSSSDNIILSTKKADNTTEALPGANYNIVVDYNTNTCKIAVNDLQFDTQKSAISFDMPDIRIAVGSTGWIIRQNEATVQTSNGTAKITNFDAWFTMRVGGSSALAGISFTIDGQYEIHTLLTTSNFTGTITSTIIGDPSNDPFTSQNPTYSVLVNRETQTAEVRIYNPQFSADMPANLGTMVFPNLPVVYTRTGFVVDMTKVIPEIATTSGSDPYPQFAITNLKVAYVAGSQVNMDFDCAAFNRHVYAFMQPY